MPPNLIGAPATAPALPTQRSPTFTALVVDDHPLIRESVAVPLHFSAPLSRRPRWG